MKKYIKADIADTETQAKELWDKLLDITTSLENMTFEITQVEYDLDPSDDKLYKNAEDAKQFLDRCENNLVDIQDDIQKYVPSVNV